MAVPTTETQVFYDGNNSIVTPYPVPFSVLREQDLHADIQLTAYPDSEWSSLDGSFTVEILPDTGFAEIRTIDPIPDTYTVRISRVVTYTQDLVYPVAGVFPSKSHEKGLDKAMQAIQQVNTGLQTHNHNGVYIRFEELAGLIPELPAAMAPSTIAGNPAGIDGPAVATPLGGGLGYDLTGILRVGGAELWRNKTIYMAARTDNPADGGSGTINDPYDASTPEKIEAVLGPLSVLKTKVNVLWGAGRFTMRPVNPFAAEPHPWFFRDGWHWRGQGKGRTVIQVPAANMDGANIMVRWSRLAGDSEFIHCASIHGITFDGRVSEIPTVPDGSGNSVKYTVALDLEGDDLTIEDCEFKNLGGNGQEIFPVSLTNGLLGDADRNCSIIMRRCRFRDIWSGINSAGIAIGGRSPGLALTNSVKQRFIITDNHITDCYPALYNVRNVLIQYNWIDSGRAKFACINCDTGNNADVHILDNVLIGAAYPYAVIGAITLGNPTEGVFDRFVIERNYLAPGTMGYLSAGIRMRGRVKDYTIKDNAYKPAGGGYTYMLLRDDAMPAPWGTPPDYPGLGDSFSPPAPGNENGEARLMLGNVYDGASATPDGVPDTVRGSFATTSFGNITAAGAFVAAGCNMGYGHLYIGHSGVVDPYTVASFGAPDITRTGIEVLNTSSGVVAACLTRTGAVPANWELQLSAGNTFLDVCNTPAGLSPVPVFRFFTTGNVSLLTANAALSADIMTPGKGTTFRSGAASPLAADIPAGTSILWKNTTTGIVCHAANDGGTIRLGLPLGVDGVVPGSLSVAGGITFRSGAAWPLAADIPAGASITWKNTTTNTLRTCANDGGTIRMSADFT